MQSTESAAPNARREIPAVDIDTLKLEDILRQSPLFQIDPAIDRIQTAHRLKLVQFWSPNQGDKILEIGCGQGGTTVVLAAAVGPGGLVHGIDNAPPDYGSPVTMVEARDFLAHSALAARIRLDIETDILAPQVDFPEASFDWVVFSLCSWYFRSIDEFGQILARTRKWARRLAYAEWDARPTQAEQIPHFMAILLRAQLEAFKKHSDANIRTLIPFATAKRMAVEAGWTIERFKSIQTPEMQDAHWEVELVLEDIKEELAQLEGMPDKFKDLIKSQAQLLNSLAQQNDMAPLSTNAFVGS